MPSTLTEPLNVLVVCGSLGVGGAEVQAAKLLPGLDQDRFNVEVAFYNQNPGYPFEQLVEAGITVHNLGTGERWQRRRFLTKAVDLMRRRRYDVVHAWMASANHYARLPAIWSGVPVVIGGLQGKVELTRRWPQLYSLMNLRCSGWIVNSASLKEYVKNQLSFMERRPVWVVKNGLEVGREAMFRSLERTAYDDLRGSRPVIGIVGRLHPVKNHRLFLEMARDLITQGVDTDFWIIGDGPLRYEIEAMIAEMGLSHRVLMLGLRSDVDVALSRMDLLVLSSHSESCPNAVLEAMRAGLPVIATRCTDFSGIIEEGRNGYTVGCEDRAALVDRVQKVLAAPSAAKNMGLHSRFLLEKNFSLEAAVDSLAKAYLDAAQIEARRSASLQYKLETLGI